MNAKILIKRAPSEFRGHDTITALEARAIVIVELILLEVEPTFPSSSLNYYVRRLLSDYKLVNLRA